MMNKYSIFFHTFDDIKNKGLGKCIATFETASVFNVGEKITDKNGHDFIITEVSHMIEWADDEAEHFIYVSCRSESLTQEEARSLEDWE